jgi:MFS family permease
VTPGEPNGPSAWQRQQHAVAGTPAGAPAGPGPEAARRAWRGALGALIAADVAFAYQQTAVLPVVPTVERQLHVTGAWGAWLLSGYLLVATLSTPLIGRFADLYGRRKLLLIGLTVFLIGSLGAALSPNFGVLVTFRALQGVGGAVFPLSLSVARGELPRERVGAATGLLTGAFGMGTTLGFATSGALAAAVSWRMVFVVGAVVVAVAIPLVLHWVPRRPAPSSGQLDLPGAALLGAALVALLVALTVAPQARGATEWALTGVLAVIAVLAASAWLRHEHRVRAPLISLHMLRSPTALWTNGITLVLGYGLFGVYYLVPQFVQNKQHGFGASTAIIGLYLLPSAVGQLLGGLTADTLRRGGSPRRPLTMGMAAMGVALAGFAVSAEGGSAPGFLAASFLLGCGVGLAIGSSSTLVTLDAGAEHASVATGLNSTVRRVGGGIGGQVSAGVLSFAGTGIGSWTSAFAVAAVLSLLAVLFCARLPRESGTSTSADPGVGEGRW